MKRLFLLLILMSLLNSCASTHKISDKSANATSLTNVQDGLSFQNAIIINKTSEKQGVDAEYEWIRNNYPGSKVNLQSLTDKNGIPYDLIDITTADGKKLTIYFNIKKFFGKF